MKNIKTQSMKIASAVIGIFILILGLSMLTSCIVADTPADLTAGATTTHTIASTTLNAGTIATIDGAFPAGFDVSGATLGTVSGISAGTISAVGQVVTYNVTTPVHVPSGTTISIELMSIVNTTTTGYYAVTVTTKDGTGSIIDGPTASLVFSINPDAIDHYSVSTISSPQTAGTAFNVTIQAQDQYNNNITSGADAAETANITFGLSDAVATPTSTITAGGTATVGMTMTVAQAGQSIIFTGATSGKIGTSNAFTINPVAIDHYSVSTISSPQIAGTAFNVTIQAQDQYNNNITSGADAAETANITFGLADAGATPTSTTTAGGTATVGVTMTVAQAGQSIIFTGATSGKIGTSNAFTVLTPPTVTTNDASSIGVNSATINGSLDDIGTAASVDVSFEWGETSVGPYPNETTPQTVNTTGAFSFDLSSLTPNTTYYFRAKAVGDGTSYGTEKSFTTLTPEYGEYDYAPYDYYLEVNALGVKKRFDVTSIGRVLETIDIACSDGVLNIHINKGTVVKDKHGKRLRTLEIAAIETPFAPLDGTYILGQAYSLLPDDTTLNPSMTLTWSYVPNALREGAHEEDLFLALYDKNAGIWVKLDCIVDVVNHTITAEVGHSTTFAVLGLEPKSVTFTVNNLIISPDKVNPGEIVNIGVSVVNSGNLTGSCKVTLKINDAVVNVEEVVVPAHTARDVAFELSRETIDSYSVDVNGLAGSFIVEGVVSIPIQPPTPTQPLTPPNPPAPKSSNWLLIVSIAVVVVIVGSASYFFAMRRLKS